MRRILVALLIVLFVAGCTPAVQGTGCARLTFWSDADQRQLAAEYRTAPPTTQRAIDDLKYMRDQARACRGESST